jgi:hypothetical protein
MVTYKDFSVIVNNSAISYLQLKQKDTDIKYAEEKLKKLGFWDYNEGGIPYTSFDKWNDCEESQLNQVIKYCSIISLLGIK